MTDKLVHTPGPWHTHIAKNGGDWKYTVRASYDGGHKTGKEIARINDRLPDKDGDFALIAAAPDLLALLRVMANVPTPGEIVNSEALGMDSDDALDILSGYIKMARDLVAKATES